MRTILHLSLSAVILGFVMLCPVLAQTAPPAKLQPKDEEAELRALQERLQKLIAELRAKEAKKAQEPKGETPKVVAPPVVFRPAVQADPTTAALEKLAKSSDPKVAALAKELLAALPKPATPGRDKLFLHFDGLPLDWKGAGLEFKIEPAPPGVKPGVPFKLKIEDLKFDIMPDGPIIKVPPKVAAVGTPAAVGTSSLKMSVDGKTAAVTNADGSIVIYDVATGKEQMRFPAKR